MRRTILLAVAALLISAPPATGRILKLYRAWPYGWKIYGQRDGGITSNLIRPYPWSQLTIAYNNQSQYLLIGCRGRGHQLVRVWTHGHGWVLTTCDGLEPWSRVLRIGPTIPVFAAVTFQ